MATMPSRNWSESEVDAAVRDYLAMLALELRGESFNKAAHNRELRQRLTDRSHGSVERKHQNISAVLISLGFPTINGYKPLGNVQGMLRQIVHEQLPPLMDLVATDVVAPQPLAAVDDVLSIHVEPPESSPPSTGEWHPEYVIAGRRPRSINYLEQEARNQSLGDAGETLAMQYETARLRHYGKDRLARNVEQVSKTVGDHAGYDIRSYELSGHDRFIEVKTTRYGKFTPFYISAAEVRFSEAKKYAYHLYRLFDFRRRPKLFTLSGDVERHVRLQAISYKAHFS